MRYNWALWGEGLQSALDRILERKERRSTNASTQFCGTMRRRCLCRDARLLDRTGSLSLTRNHEMFCSLSSPEVQSPLYFPRGVMGIIVGAFEGAGYCGSRKETVIPVRCAAFAAPIRNLDIPGVPQRHNDAAHQIMRIRTLVHTHNPVSLDTAASLLRRQTDRSLFQATHLIIMPPIHRLTHSPMSVVVLRQLLSFGVLYTILRPEKSSSSPKKA